MTTLTYTTTEVRRTLRNKRFFVFSLGFPLVLYLLIAGEHRHATVDGIHFPLYYLSGMMGWGTMSAVVAGGARIALERSVGWTRQMRVTPLSVRAYFATKILTGYLMAVISIVLLTIAGIALGTDLSAVHYLEMVGLILVGLAPLAILGVALGHVLSPDSMGPALGGVTTLLALLGGSFGPLATSGVLLDIAKALPSYWLTQAGKAVLHGGGWAGEGWLVIAIWTIVLVRITSTVYRRDTGRA